MPTNRLNLCVVLVAFGWAATASARPGDGPPARRAYSDSEAKGEESAMITGTGEATPPPASCQVFGGFDELHAGRNRYRGNAYRMEYDAELGTEYEANLVEIRMELRFVGEVNLYFSVHRARSEETAPYERVMSDVVVAAVGDGTAAMYSTGPLSQALTLETGFDYLIGAGWGQTNNPASRDVTYGRDVQTYPVPFLHGQILGLVADNTAPPLGDTLTGIVVFDSGAYSMELCFEPVPGACCIPPDPDTGYPGGCEERLPGQCVDVGGWFHGQRTVCDPNLCDFGACCGHCVECLDDYTREACEADGGIWAGADVPCPPSTSTGDLCPEITGACCDGADCREVCDDHCDGPGEKYLGDGTTCEPNFCAGACCVYGTGCGDTTRRICEDLAGGFFIGEGTTCDALPPELECGGACCAEFLGQPICGELLREECVDGGGVENTVYMGDAIGCWDVDQCTISFISGACCLPNGSCLITSQDFCEGSGRGDFVQDGTCDEVTCTACCTGTGECYMSATGECPVPDMVIGPSCVPDRCVIPIGVCCYNDGTCQGDYRRDDCEGEGGRFQEGDTECATNQCPESFGACCRPNGTCTDGVTESECEDTLNGTYHDGTVCDSADCPALGACCLDDGTCFVKLSNVCEDVAGLGGSFVGAGVECGPDTCPTGACCVGSECIVPEVTRAACVARLGDYRGDGTVCSDETIKCGDIEGACCMPNETCQLKLPQACFDEGGKYQGEGVPCEGDVCTLGACCPPDFPDSDCVDDVLPLECDAEGGEWYPGVACLERPCDPRGACCNGGDCTIEQELDCLIAGGVYQGDDIECSPGLCTLGACCHLDGTCEDGVVASTCEDPNAQFYPNGDCDRDCFPRGACCENRECHAGLTQLQCENMGGTYDGDGTVCREELCVLVPCCEEPDPPVYTCRDQFYTRQQCEMLGGVYAGPGAECSTVDCMRGACCRADGTCSADDTIRVWCENPEDFQPRATCNDCVGRGVCCVPGDETCHIMEQEVCQLQYGGRYGGDGKTCEPSDMCAVGACCMLDENCNETTRLDCDLAGGIYVAATCGPPGYCTRGACCELDGTCLNDTVAPLCTAVGSEFHSGTTCEMLDPPCAPRGACCKEGVCFEALTQVQCETDGGTYDGDGTVCRENLCTVVACCEVPDPPSYPCTEDYTLQECEMGGGVYVGPGATCEGADCTRGACCRADGTCTVDDTIAVWCEDPEDFQPGATCDDCVGRGVCCLPDDQTCYVMTQYVCEVQNGGMYGGDATTCEPSIRCRVGACCMGGGMCQTRVPQACLDDGGDYQGDGIPCGGNVCTRGACCPLAYPDRPCQDDVLPLACMATCGESHPAVACLENPCDPTGACCNGGYCTTEREADCAGAGGVYLGDDTECVAGLCTLGACCHLDGTCEDGAVASTCTDPRAHFYPNRDCSQECFPRGACCKNNECLEEQTQLQCEADGGTYDGDGTWCREDLCASVACCMPDGCYPPGVYTRQQCETLGGVYAGPGAECGTTDCTRGACCRTDGTCAMEDTIGVWCEDPEDFDPGATCNECVGRGVCCVPGDDLCHIMKQAVCQQQHGGRYGGDATTCEPSDLCRVGACCMLDETCDDTQTGLDCELAGGIYLGPGAVCDETIDCRRGACCDGATYTCQDSVTPQQCQGANQEWTESVLCADLDPPCVAPTGACCMDAPCCSVMTESQCVDAGGSYQGDDTPCEPDPCAPEGACCNRTTYICQDFLTFEECLHEWTQGVLCADLDPPCVEPTGACCDWTTYICQDSVTLQECQGSGQEWTQDVLCADLDPPCEEPTGACCIGATCLVMTESQCANAGGSYQGNDISCEPNPCRQLSIVSSDPPDCALDARQPSKPDGSEPAGWSSILITCDGDTSGLTIQDFSLEIPYGSMPGPPADVIPSGNDVTVVFPEIIPPGEWSCVVYNVDGTKICLGYMPANVNSDTKSAPADILYLIDCLNGVRTCESWQCDVDRSEVCGPPDILRVIDLLNGAGSYEVWLNRPIIACPTAP